MALSNKERTQRRDTVQHAHLLHTQTRGTYLQQRKAGKELKPNKQLFTGTVTYTILLEGHGATASLQKSEKKEVTSLWDRRVLSPTTVGVVAPGPDSSRGLRTLSALLAQTRRSTTPAALPRPPSVPPWTGRSPSRERRTKTRKRLSLHNCQSRRAKRKRKSQRERNPRGRSESNSRESTGESAPCACPSFMERGSALCSTPFSAPPPFEAFREASRKGACPHSDRLTP